MTMYQQDTLIENLLSQTETLLKKAIVNIHIEWKLIPYSQFALRPSPESWSANECLQHLNSDGRYYLLAIEKALNRSRDNEPATQFSTGWLGVYFTKLMMPAADGKLSKKMKTPKGHSPKTIIESHLAISEFIDQQEKLLVLLADAKKFDLNKVKLTISIAPFIKLKLGDVLMFLIAHQVRHRMQAERALASTGVVLEKVKVFSLTSHS